MRKSIRLLCLCLALLALLPGRGDAQTSAPVSPTYGAYPESYQEIVGAWLNASLVDPKSVVVKWLGPPKRGKLDVGKGRQVAGYLVDFTVNARNVFGAYTGPQKHTALVRDGHVVTATGFFGR